MESDRKNRDGPPVRDQVGPMDAPAVESSCASDATASALGVRLDRATQTRIGDQLRAMYGELLEQPVPDRFRSLLSQLDEATAERRADESGDREASR